MGHRGDNPSRDYWRGRHTVYRCTDVAGQLLYIGTSTDVCQRLKQHRSQMPWWPEVARVRVEIHRTRPAAFAAEREAIESERPMHNRQYLVA